MGNKFSNKYIWVLMLVLGVFVMAVTALIGGNSSIRNAQQTAQRTLQYLQNQCISYRDIVAADRLKSLVRLTEQAQEVAEREGMVGQNRSNEELARYAQRQRVTCVLVLDKDLEIEFSSGADMDWSDYYTNEAIRSIMDYPEKIFARRLTRDGAVYDIAAVARVENPGVVFCVRLQSNTIIASYRASIESLLAGYETLLNDRVYTYITDGERVVGSSAAEQWNLPVDEVPLIRALESSPSPGSKLTQLRTDGTFFGARERYQQYSLYVFLPNEYVFILGKNMVISAFGVYALAAVLATLLVLRTTQERKRREMDYQHRLEEEVRRASAADQAKTHFLRSMSHDIRTPINIIGNAIKYNHPGGWVRCSFRESRYADGVCRLEFICEDNGAGMSETFQRHMFEAFAQENSDRGSLSGGVGLGLAVVKKLVDERGGTIQVDSALGQGTRFRVVLPMMPSEAEPEAALPDAAASIAGRRLLVAEDNELNREIAVYLLQEAGAVVDQAADGKEAVEMFAASAPGTYDAVLMDVMMPELDGLAATRAIRGMDRPDAQLPIIAMTANLFDEDVAACLAAGMDAHIPKPLEAGQMIRTIAEWLERKKQ